MPTCCVPNCVSGYKSAIRSNTEAGTSNPRFFKLPNPEKNPELFHSWERNIRRSDRPLTVKDSVCSRHFQKEYILDSYETKLHDGTIHRFPRGKVSLTKGAIPTLFPDSPSYISTKINVRKSPKKRSRPITNRSGRLPKRMRVHFDSSNCNSVDSASPSSEISSNPNVDEECDIPIILEEVNRYLSGPTNWIYSVTSDSTCIILILTDGPSDFTPLKRIIIHHDLQFKVFVGNVLINIDNFGTVRQKSDVGRLIDIVETMKMCNGSWTNLTDSTYKCMGFVTRGTLCSICSSKKISMNSKRVTVEMKRTRCKEKRHSFRIKMKYWRTKAITLRSSLKKLKQQFSRPKALQNLKKQIDFLPQSQQESILACIEAAKCSEKGIRYTRTFMFECILLKIKSRKAYNHVRKRKLVHLPSLSTIYRYVRQLRSSFGFSQSMFDVMKKKSAEMRPEAVRGILAIDEMKLSPNLSFDKSSLETIGFTDLGKYTPEQQRNEQGDHALVLQFQPFQGAWIQSVAAFLSRGAATGTVLTQIILEAVILIENAGFKVDGIVTDGAQWNRTMWKEFGVTTEKPSCEHIADSARQLWFFSDFPHLVKNFWTWVISKNEFRTPDGVVKRCHWNELIKAEKSLSLKACPKLNMTHMSPKNHEKMNVARAYQFFSHDVAAGMQLYKPNIPELQDCDSTCRFIKRVGDVITAFNSRTPKNALRANSSEEQIIRDFLAFLQQCNDELMTKSTRHGFVVTCRATLELFEFLKEKCNFRYLMLCRLNQDNLERFFGMVRALCGNNDNPDPKIFLLVFRLMSAYSLIKPPQGCNVTGADLLDSLIQTNDLNLEQSQKSRWKVVKNIIVEKSSASYFENPLTEDDDVNIYPNVNSTDESILQYLAGYVCRKAQKLKRCAECNASLTSDLTEPMALIDLRNYYGALRKPSAALLELLKIVESTIMNEIRATKMRPDTFFSIAYHLQDLYSLPRIGCNQHYGEVTGYTIQFYLIMRMHFLCNEINKTVKNRSKPQELRKIGKLLERPAPLH